MKLTRLLIGLYLLAGSSLAVAEEKVQLKPANHIIAYYFHGTIRCETCLKIEKQTRELIEGRFKDELATNRLAFKSINYEIKENSHFQQDYKLPFPSVVLVRQENGKDTKWKLLGQTWALVEDRAAFDRYVEKQVTAFLSGVESASDDSTAEPVSESAPGIKMDSLADLNTHFGGLRAAMVFVHATNESSVVDWTPINGARRAMESEWEIKLGLFELKTTPSDYHHFTERFPPFRLPTVMVMLQNGSATMLSGGITESNLIQEFRYSVSAAGCCPFGEP